MIARQTTKNARQRRDTSRINGLGLALGLTLGLGGLAGRAAAQANVNETNISRTLYVSPGGDDSNPGTSASLPLATIQRAVDLAGSTNTRIILADGYYRTYTTIGAGNNTLILQAQNTGQAIITGSDAVTSWTSEGNGIYSIPWTNNWGVGDVTFTPGYDANRDLPKQRREMLFIDDVRLTQRSVANIPTNTADPVTPSALNAGEFTVNESLDKIYFKPPVGVTLSTSTRVEISTRGNAPGVDSQANTRNLIKASGHSNLVFRGLVFEHSANYIKGDAPLYITSTGVSNTTDPTAYTSNILVDSCTFRQNNALSFELAFVRNVTVKNIDASNNGERGAGSFGIFNVLVQDSRFNSNNWRYGQWLRGHDAAGWKMFDGTTGGYIKSPSDTVKFLRCKFNGNDGMGFWQDYGGRNVTLDHCLLENNFGGGVMQEMTPGPLNVTGCVIRNNAENNLVIYGSPRIYIDSSWIYGVISSDQTAATYCPNIHLFCDDRTNNSLTESSGRADWRNCKITNSTIIADVPGTQNFYFNNYGGRQTYATKQQFYRTITSDYNRWYRRDQTSFPYPLTFPGANVYNNWQDSYPDATWDMWRTLTSKKGMPLNLDAHSVWGDADLTNVPDPTVQ